MRNYHPEDDRFILDYPIPYIPYEIALFYCIISKYFSDSKQKQKIINFLDNCFEKESYEKHERNRI